MIIQNLHSLEFVESILNTIREPLVVLDQHLTILTASQSFYRSFSMTPEKTEGLRFYDIGNGQWNIPELRTLLRKIVHEDTTVEGFEVEHVFPTLGPKTFLLNARRVQASNGPIDAILLAMEDVTKRKIFEDELRRMALTDPLTGLANRNKFNESLDEALKISRRFKLGIALLLLDLDDFKRVNDAHGHPVGDALLKEVATALIDGAREIDFVARLGGDEFAVILKGAANKEDAKKLAQRYVDMLRRPFSIESHAIHIGTSIGISLFPDDADNDIDLFRRADMALYQAKREGRNTFRLFAPDLEKKKNN